MFPRRGGIIEVASTARHEDYPAEFADLVAEVQDRHFWFAARNDVILSTMRKAIGALAGRSALEVGCGTGAVLPALERAGMFACGIDMHRSALLHARARTHGPLVWTSATALPFFSDFDVVLLCDVIEHADDDVALLVEAGRAVKEGGVLVVTVPAGPHLWTRYDEVIGHKRRYTHDSLESSMTRAGFTWHEILYFNCLLAVGQQIQRRFSTGTGKAPRDATRIVRETLRVPETPLNQMFRLLMRLDGPISRVGRISGASLIAIARRG